MTPTTASPLAVTLSLRAFSPVTPMTIAVGSGSSLCCQKLCLLGVHTCVNGHIAEIYDASLSAPWHNGSRLQGSMRPWLRDGCGYPADGVRRSYGFTRADLLRAGIFTAPLHLGGMGMIPLASEHHLCFLALHLAARMPATQWPVPLDEWTADEISAINRLEEEASQPIEGILKSDIHSLQTNGYGRALETLPERPFIPRPVKDGTHGLCTELTCLATGCLGLTPAWIHGVHKASLAWWSAETHVFLPDPYSQACCQATLEACRVAGGLNLPP